MVVGVTIVRTITPTAVFQGGGDVESVVSPELVATVMRPTP